MRHDEPMLRQTIVNTFAGNPLDRAAERRTDAAWLAARLEDPSARVVVIRDGRPFVVPASERTDETAIRLAYVDGATAKALAGDADHLVFLGLDDEAPVFAVECDEASRACDEALAGRGRFDEMRPAALALPPAEAAIAGAAKSLFDWRRRHGFCSACGEPTRPHAGGWMRVCPACESQHFPRVDPVVIMLPVLDGRCLLGRQASWPAGRMSAIAGFVEPGESIEEACARELAAETGLKPTNIVYHSSQPWPWPSSLMIGLVAEVADDRATPDGVELEDVRWFSRDDARAVLDGTHPEISAPAPIAIARQLLAAWVDGFEP
jgi:NAD+ diphosphatase